MFSTPAVQCCLLNLEAENSHFRRSPKGWPTPFIAVLLSLDKDA